MSTLSKSEASYIRTSLLSTPPLRADGRALLDYRPIALETGIAPLANGSARINIGLKESSSSSRANKAGVGVGGTEVIGAVKLEVEDVRDGSDGRDGGRVVCTVSCSPQSHSHLSPPALEDLSSDLTHTLHSTLSHHSLLPPNLSIIPGKKSWLINIDLLVLSDAGNLYDALFLAAHAALHDTKVVRTRGVEYRPPPSTHQVPKIDDSMNVDTDADEETGAGETQSGFDTRRLKPITDFELDDYWDEGDPLGGSRPICITINLVQKTHYLDATPQEEQSTPLRLLLIYSFPPSPSHQALLQGMKLLGGGEVALEDVKKLIGEGEKYARDLYTALETKLKEEDVRRGRKAREKLGRS
ncbi:hypothetical protein JAAARDRAFT_177168 [Jaapia argillacea MUCL 33604]|uniref:Ribosomal RNA-processing protein 42 n=1 Tax=Jaapia argillacea MUCL 33604 TaxID=933084 RepID=A0A067Q3G9_9AGAM|nr:hypothetical protein JAAARDRAFT_177168 [Jaapia argillacea MUCL 33604]